MIRKWWTRYLVQNLRPRSRFIRYICVGVWNSLFGWTTYLVCLRIVGWLGGSYLLATIPAQIIGIAQAVVMQRNVVFSDSNRSLFSSLWRASSIHLLFYATNTPVFYVMVSKLGLSPALASAIMIALTAVSSFYLHKHFSFR